MDDLLIKKASQSTYTGIHTHTHTTYNLKLYIIIFYKRLLRWKIEIISKTLLVLMKSSCFDVEFSFKSTVCYSNDFWIAVPQMPNGSAIFCSNIASSPSFSIQANISIYC